MKLIERKYYLEKLKNVVGTPDIKVITGIRRCGKSKLMDAFIEYLQTTQEKKNIIRIKLTLKEFANLNNGDSMYDYVSQNYKCGMTNYLFIDEVQLCKNFETIINSLYEEEKYDIYLTGSNAFLLSSDLATLFGGRVFEIPLFPFSFAEYLAYYPSLDISAAFENYVTKGGMAGSYLYPNSEDASQYLVSLVRSTITKDVVQKSHLENEPLLNMISDFLMDNIGNNTSIRSIANALTSNTYKTNDKTVGTYISSLCKSFLFYPIKRYDIKGKRYLESSQKYYLADTSLRFAILGHKNMDYGHIYENIVAIELLRRGYEVYIGILGDKEVDFVVMKRGIKTYIQVCDDISAPNTLSRELTPLLSIKDAYPKIILANTKHDDSQIEGVQIIDIARWLSFVSQF